MDDNKRALQAEIGLWLLMANIDGEISEEEVVACGELCGERAGALAVTLGPDEHRELMRAEASRMEELLEDLDDPTPYLTDLAGRIPVDHRAAAFATAAQVAFADDFVTLEEEALLHQIGRVLDLDPALVKEIAGADAAAEGDAHEDEPDDSTRLIVDRLTSRGWFDAFQQLRDAGITVTGGGAAALQYKVPNGHLLRLEHHPCDGSLHFHVTDESDVGLDLVLFPDASLGELLDRILDLQGDVTLASFGECLPGLLEVARVCTVENGRLRDLG